MFIELTDHLRCPEDHEEAYLVLLPGTMDGRLVSSGVIGCPVCHVEVTLAEGVADFGGGFEAQPTTSLAADAAHALLGLDGPGGYLALVGGVAALAEALGALLPGVRLVLVNPPPGTADSPLGSVVRARRLPLKARSMRGVVIDGESAAQPGWLDAAIGAVLPGLRIVAEGAAPEHAGVHGMAQAGGWWGGRVTG
jgi:hypothetical protein